jgi:hypothetical protein
MACRATTRAGTPCRAPEMTGRGWCFHHDPDGARKRTEARRRGGLRAHGLDPTGPAVEVRLQVVADVMTLLETAAGDALRMQPSAVRARTLCNVATVALRVLDVGALADRIEALEQRVTWRQPRGVS